MDRRLKEVKEVRDRRPVDDGFDKQPSEQEEFEEGCYLFNPELAGTTGSDREEEMESLFESLESLGED